MGNLSNSLTRTLLDLEVEGYSVIPGVLSYGFIESLKDAMYQAQVSIKHEIGEERLRRAGELGVLRVMFKHDPIFYRMLEIPEMLEILDATIGPSSILHLQNGFILPSVDKPVFQNTMHQDFKHGHGLSINFLFALDDFTEQNGATVMRSKTGLETPITCKAGSMIAFESDLWHKAGVNRSGKDRLAINQQFTKHWIKQQIDYVRALDCVHPRLGGHARVPSSLAEYYQEPRIYKANQ